MTVHKLLTGQDKPLSQQEFLKWKVYYEMKEELQKQAQKG